MSECQWNANLGYHGSPTYLSTNSFEKLIGQQSKGNTDGWLEQLVDRRRGSSLLLLGRRHVELRLRAWGSWCSLFSLKSKMINDSRIECSVGHFLEKWWVAAVS